jgi:hypothetical protein
MSLECHYETFRLTQSPAQSIHLRHRNLRVPPLNWAEAGIRIPAEGAGFSAIVAVALSCGTVFTISLMPRIFVRAKGLNP